MNSKSLLKLVKNIYRFLLSKSRLDNVYLNYLWSRRIDLDQNATENSAIIRLGLMGKVPSEDEIESIRKLFADSVPLNSITFQRLPATERREKALFEVRNARLLGIYAIAVSEGRIIRDSIYGNQNYTHSFLDETLKSAPRQVFGSLQPFYHLIPKKADIHLDTACVLCSKWHNYYHWITDHLTKLQAVEIYEELTGIKPVLIIPANANKYIYDSLSILGFADYEILEWTFATVDVKKLVIPSRTVITEETGRWLKKKILSSNKFQPENLEKRGKFIFPAEMQPGCIFSMKINWKIL